MSVDRSPSATTLTGPAIEGYRVLLLKHALKLYLDVGIITTRGVTPTVMRQLAAKFTGKGPYPRSRKGLQAAYADVTAMADGKSLDQLGTEVSK